MNAAERYEPGVSPYDYEQHVAWLDSLSPDDSLVVHTPAGHKHSMLIAAYTKRVLQYEMPTADRLQFLEKLNGLTDLYFTPEMLALIEPMSDTEIAMVNEARSLDPEDDRLGRASFNVLTSWRVFGHLRRLNPSYLAAMKLRERLTAERKAAPAQAI
jgi:hypothetical protein